MVCLVYAISKLWPQVQIKTNISDCRWTKSRHPFGNASMQPSPPPPQENLQFSCQLSIGALLVELRLPSLEQQSSTPSSLTCVIINVGPIFNHLRAKGVCLRKQCFTTWMLTENQLRVIVTAIYDNMVGMLFNVYDFKQEWLHVFISLICCNDWTIRF